jgi:hypothetical protein
MIAPQDPRRPDGDIVHLEDPQVVETWTRSLGISREELQRAVAEAGPSTGAVYDYIQRKRVQRPPDRRA